MLRFRGHWVVGRPCQIEAFSSATTPWCWARKDGYAKFLPLRHFASKSVMFASSRIAMDPRLRPPGGRGSPHWPGRMAPLVPASGSLPTYARVAAMAVPLQGQSQGTERSSRAQSEANCIWQPLPPSQTAGFWHCRDAGSAESADHHQPCGVPCGDYSSGEQSPPLGFSFPLLNPVRHQDHGDRREQLRLVEALSGRGHR